MSQSFSLLGIKHPLFQHWEQDTSSGSWDTSDHRYIFLWDPKCICHSPFITNGGQGKLSICHVQRGSVQLTVWLQLVLTHALSLPYFRSCISSVLTSFHDLRPWYLAAKQQKDLISTDLVTTECSEGCWSPLRGNEWGNLAHFSSELQVMDTQAEGSEHSETSGERGKETEFVPFQETLKSFSHTVNSLLAGTIIKYKLKMTIYSFSYSQISL